MVLLGDEAQMVARFSPFEDSISFQCKIGAQFAPIVQ
jgi:hypothetical protein